MQAIFALHGGSKDFSCSLSMPDTCAEDDLSAILACL